MGNAYADAEYNPAHTEELHALHQSAVQEGMLGRLGHIHVRADFQHRNQIPVLHQEIHIRGIQKTSVRNNREKDPVMIRSLFENTAAHKRLPAG